jgi:hypothetical protein
MKLLFIWSIFTIIIGFSKLNTIEYILTSLIMLYATQFYNTFKPIKISIKKAITISCLPNVLLWYLAYKCNDFLWLDPYSWLTFISMFCIYIYSLIYIIYAKTY